MENECKRRKNPRKCAEYYGTLVEKGKDLEKIFEFKKIGEGAKEKEETKWGSK